MKTTITQADGMATVKITGELRIATVADVRAELLAVLAACDDIQIDLSEVERCDTAGIQLLLMACNSARSASKRFSAVGRTAPFLAALERVGIAVEQCESPGHRDNG